MPPPVIMSSLYAENFITQTDNPSKTTQIPKNPIRYRTYEERLKSFENFPNKEISAQSLAAAGFFYKQHSDVVQCPFCLIEGYQWVSGDDPMLDHRTWSPNCPFVMNRVQHDNHVTTNDTCGLYGIQILPNSVPEDLAQLGIKKTNGPVQPSKFSVESRLATFETWPKSKRQTPQQLAEAGFYYIGVGDQTMCFYCGGGLKDWDENDDPWEEHAKWFPRCNFLYLQKGDEYIDMIKNKNKAQASSPVTETKENSTIVAASSIPAETKNCAQDSQESSTPKNDSKALCKICYKNKVEIVFMPCGHLVACVNCAGAMRNCPICRKPLKATFRTFLS